MERGEYREEGLPPHDMEAEQGVLGCCLLDGAGAVQQALERFGSAPVFFDLRHQEIFGAMAGLLAREEGIDTLTVQSALRDRQKLEACGGLAYLAALPDVVPSVANLPTYLGLVWEKYLARQLVATATRVRLQVLERNGVSEALIAGAARQWEEWRELASRRDGVRPQDLKKPGEFGDGCFRRWFKEKLELMGFSLPFNIPFRIRSHEATYMVGDSGSGKSTFLAHLLVDVIKQGGKCCLASLEMPCEVTLWMMTRQVLGQGPTFPDTAEYHKRVGEAVAFLERGLWFYDFVGITRWRELLDVFRYAREKEGVDVFVLDSVMRIGIPEDDLAEQAAAAAEFGNFPTKMGGHLIYVNHVNKGDGGVKKRATGSKRWSDNANNVMELRRNEAKAQKWSDLTEKRRVGMMEEEEYTAKARELEGLWDSKFEFDKQRYPGLPQNGSKYLWFDHGRSMQFRDRREDGPVDYLAG